LGAAPRGLDPHRAGSGRRRPLECQTADESLLSPPTWTAEELGKRGSIERFFGRFFSRVFSLFGLFGLFGLFRVQRPPLAGWSAVARCVALTEHRL
jgi:hypothetical protein